MYRREVQLQQVALVGAALLTDTASLPAARKAVLQSLADTADPTAGGRRLLLQTTGQLLSEHGLRVGLIPSWPPQSTPMAYSFFLSSWLESGSGCCPGCGSLKGSLRLSTALSCHPPMCTSWAADLTESASVTSILELAAQLAEAPPPTAGTPSDAVVQAVASAIATMNAIIEASTTVDAIQEVSPGGSCWRACTLQSGHSAELAGQQELHLLPLPAAGGSGQPDAPVGQRRKTDFWRDQVRKAAC